MSLSMGTSVGTITLITPIAVGGVVCVRLPAAVRGQRHGRRHVRRQPLVHLRHHHRSLPGIGLPDEGQVPRELQDRFLPRPSYRSSSSLALSFGADLGGSVVHEYDLIQLIPYLIVLVGGINRRERVRRCCCWAFCRALSSWWPRVATAATDLLANMGSGAAGMFETTMVALLVSAICALIREYGGFVALLNGIKSLFKSKKGGQLGMGLLVGAMDIATANNTVAIVISNPIRRRYGEDVRHLEAQDGIAARHVLVCFQGILPYGAQMLVAISAATELGFAVSAFQIIPFLFYPFLLLISSLVFIFIVPDKEELTEEGKRFATRGRELVQKTRIVAAQRSFGPAVAVY